MVVLGGYPSDGKTALALQFAFGIGKSHRVGFFSYESTRDKLFDRTVSRAAMLSYTKIKRNQLTEADYRDLLELRPQLTAPQLTLIDAAGMTVLDIQAYSQAHRYDVVFVDYLQKIAAPRGTRQSDFERVSAISSSLQQFGRITGTTVVALSQLSRPDRDAKTNKIRPPVLSDLRSSGQIEQDADVVLFLHREDYDDKQSNRILKIAKNKRARPWTTFGSGLTAICRPSPGSRRRLRSHRWRSPNGRSSRPAGELLGGRGAASRTPPGGKGEPVEDRRHPDHQT